MALGPDGHLQRNHVRHGEWRRERFRQSTGSGEGEGTPEGEPAGAATGGAGEETVEGEFKEV